MARPDDPPQAPVAIPDRRARIGLIAGVAITLVAIAVAVAFGIADDAAPGQIVTAAVEAQDGGIEGPVPPPPAPGEPGAAAAAFAAAAGWTPLGSRTDTVGGRTVTTVFWGHEGRRVAVTVLPGDAAPPPDGARRTGRRGLLLYSFEVGPRTAVTWTEDDRTSVLSAIAVPRGELYDLAGGPPKET
ncbi:MAG TPA: hypothetical protein VM844_04935 [Miltoncostaeaceae bacterium]|nr:hypothetical protein [Miltoncostaeaceae bacterium]